MQGEARYQYLILSFLALSSFLFITLLSRQLLTCSSSVDISTPQIPTPIQNATTNSAEVSRETVQEYKPAKIEKYIMDHLVELGMDNDVRGQARNIKGCAIWQDPKVAPEIYDDLQSFREELNNYYKEINEFEPIPDLMTSIRETNSHDVCKKARIHEEGLQGLFPGGQLSESSSGGFIEPLYMPMRHPNHCFWAAPEDMAYFIHDFEEICRTLKPTSRRVLIDIGASFSMHDKIVPIVWLLELYKKFGFTFDHIYGFELTPTNTSDFYNELLPDEFMASYHWINTAVTSEIGHKLNPLDSIVRKFNKDDFIIVKLDIDHYDTEIPLAKQLLSDESLHELVDHFYFENHVIMDEMGAWWTNTMKGSVKSSFDLFYGLREKGVSSHFWI